jgi:hypothetical protein
MSRYLLRLSILLFPLSLFAAGHDISTSASRQSLPVVTGNGAGFTSAWLEQSDQVRSIVAGRVNHAGEPLDGPGIAIDQKPTFLLSIAHSSSESLIVWTMNFSLFAARLSPLGVRLDTTPLLITNQLATNQLVGDAAVAWNGSRYFVVWTRGLQLMGAFVGPDGVVTAPKALLTQSSPSDIFAPDVSWDGRQFVVVFGEASPNSGPICTCATYPDHVRVMRVSAAGDAIDGVPMLIPGVHLTAHVASSGTESLIALGATFDTSAIIVREEDGVLKLGPEVPIFHWFNPLSSDVTWDGSSYEIGWRYSATGTIPGWLGFSRISRTGIPIGSFFTPTAGLPDNSVLSFPPKAPSIATNDAGEIALVTSDMASPSAAARAHLYLITEFTPTPAAPPAPRNAVSYLGGSKARIDWQNDGGADGFLIEQSVDFRLHWFPVDVVAPEVRTVTMTASVGNQFRVSAFGPGGLSAATITSIGSPPRLRAQR